MPVSEARNAFLREEAGLGNAEEQGERGHHGDEERCGEREGWDAGIDVGGDTGRHATKRVNEQHCSEAREVRFVMCPLSVQRCRDREADGSVDHEIVGDVCKERPDREQGARGEPVWTDCGCHTIRIGDHVDVGRITEVAPYPSASRPARPPTHSPSDAPMKRAVEFRHDLR